MNTTGDPKGSPVSLWLSGRQIAAPTMEDRNGEDYFVGADAYIRPGDDPTSVKNRRFLTPSPQFRKFVASIVKLK